MSAEARFIKEFEKDYRRHAELQKGDTLTVTDVGLAARGDGNGVAIVYTLQDEHAITHNVEVENTILFDGDYSREDAAMRLRDTLGLHLSDKEIARRLDKVFNDD